jgi:hypothetical protein
MKNKKNGKKKVQIRIRGHELDTVTTQVKQCLLCHLSLNFQVVEGKPAVQHEGEPLYHYIYLERSGEQPPKWRISEVSDSAGRPALAICGIVPLSEAADLVASLLSLAIELQQERKDKDIS